MARFPDGARVCFVGDSITATYDHPARIAEYYINNFPDVGVVIYDSGVAGGTAVSQLTFLEDDTLCHSPTHAVVMLGVNDSGRWMLGEEKNRARYDSLVRYYEDYKKNLAALCDALEKKGVEITLCTPAPYAEYQSGGSAEPPFPGGYALMAGYAEHCRRFAESRGYPVCDYHAYLTEKLQTENIYRDDYVHPDDKGQYYMAKCFLEFQGYDIGEYKEIPEKFSELRRVSLIVRDIFAVELMIVGVDKYDLPLEEKLAIVEKYVADKKASTPYFEHISTAYLLNKRDQQKYADLTETLTRQLMP